ncbi:MAG TPA: hypothetical protein VLF18_14050 [Tahibacter sp.]|uniref:hypothetical protein n=1 Tax=Tahibacter sp. TaxID=2056211 RepID=UPI002BF5F501|nr:hypothetical protein [Tahibacter sp.]HSX61319.1 hypothetical protein [Tahibacter sp.]
MSAEAQPAIRPERPRPPSVDPAQIAARVLPLRRALLHELRWRPPDVNRRRVAIAIVVVLLAHLLIVLLVRDGMRMKPFADDRRDVLRVSLIERPPPPLPEASTVRELPPMSVTAPPTGTARNAPAPTRREQAVRPVEAPAPSAGESEGVVATPAAPSLYNADGSLRVSPVAPVTEPLHPLERDKLAAEEMLQRGHNIVRCKRTRFARAYTPDESLGERAARKYGAYVGLYNPAVAQQAAKRAADARENCDWEE